MDDSLIEKNNNEFRRKYTINTIDSFPEFQNKLYLSKIIISINIFSLIFGIYILLNSKYYLNPNYNFPKSSFLFYYIVIFTFELFCILILAFLFTLLIKLIISIKQCFLSKSKNNEQPKDREKEKEINLEENNNIIFLKEIENADNIGLIPYTLSLCIFLNIILYIFGFPCSIYLIYFLVKNDFYCNYSDFFLLYLFIIINNISGGIFLFILFAFIRNKTYNSLRKLSFNYDEDNLMAVYKEVKDSINMAN